MNTADKLNNFLKEMSHFDPDNMEMGAKAVCELVLSGQLKLEDSKQTADKIREAFIKQMQSDNYNVHAHAIRCIADMVPKLPSDQVENIFSKIIRSIADKDLDQKKRQIYGICAGTVIHQAAQQYGQKLSQLFVESVNQLMKSKDQKNQIEVILINVISEFIRKWPRISSNSKAKFDCNQLVIYLLKNVQTKTKLEIVKKSQAALGKVALILTKNNLQTLFQNHDYGILIFLRANLGVKNAQKMKSMRNGLLCLANILKTHNSQIKYWAHSIAKILINSVHSYKDYDNIDHIDLTCDILDSSIICLSYLLKSYSRELEEFLNDPSQPLNNFVQELINFNIQGQMSQITLEKESMEDQYEGGDDQYGYYQAQGDNDQKGWKVRRATMHYIIVLLKKNKTFKNKVSSSPQLINALSSKLVESNSMVSEMAFQTFNNLIQSISTQKNVSADEQIQQISLMRVKSNQKDLAKTLIDEINKRIQVILESPKFSDQLKIEGSRIIFRLIQIFKDDLNENSELVNSLLNTLSKQLQKTQIVQNKNYALLALKQLVSNNRSVKQYEQILKQALKILKGTNLKLVASAYKFLRSYLKAFPKETFNSPYFPQILSIIKTKLKEHDADRLVKYNVVKCLGPIFTNYIQNLSSEDQRQIITALNTKLNIQIQKNYILEQINRIPSNYSSKDNVKLYKETLQLVSNNLGSSNTELNFQVMGTTTKIMKILGENLDKKIVEHILNKSRPIFSEYKVPQFMKIIINRYPDAVKPYAQSIIKSTESEFIQLLIQNKIVAQSQCIKILRSIDRQDSAKNISLILAKIGVSEAELKSQINQSKWGLICLGALGYLGNLSSAKYLMGVILSNKNQQFKLQAASALGNISSRNQAGLISEITILAQKSNDYYIFIYSLKEYLNFKIQSSHALNSFDGKITEWLFAKSLKQFEGQSIYHLIAQCIGKIAFISSGQITKIVKFAQSSEQNHRYVVANSLRFYFQGRSNILQEQSLFDYLKKTVELIGDKSVNVRCSATKSLNSIASSHFSLIKPHLGQYFWNFFKNNLHFDESLIVEVDYGISKQKKDLGRPLRIQSFNLLRFITKNITLQHQLVDELMFISLTNLNKQTNPDLIIKRLSTVRNLCLVDFTQFISHITLFIQKIGIQEGVLKSYQKKTIAQDQRSDVYLKSILKQITLVNKLAQKQNIDQIRGYITTLKAVQRFNAILESEQIINAQND